MVHNSCHLGYKQATFVYSRIFAALPYNRGRRSEMKKQEKQIEVEVNGIPDLNKAPKDLLQLICAAMLEVIELLDKESR